MGVLGAGAAAVATAGQTVDADTLLIEIKKRLYTNEDWSEWLAQYPQLTDKVWFETNFWPHLKGAMPCLRAKCCIYDEPHPIAQLPAVKEQIYICAAVYKHLLPIGLNDKLKYELLFRLVFESCNWLKSALHHAANCHQVVNIRLSSLVVHTSEMCDLLEDMVTPYRSMLLHKNVRKLCPLYLVHNMTQIMNVFTYADQTRLQLAGDVLEVSNKEAFQKLRQTMGQVMQDKPLVTFATQSKCVQGKFKSAQQLRDVYELQLKNTKVRPEASDYALLLTELDSMQAVYDKRQDSLLGITLSLPGQSAPTTSIADGAPLTQSGTEHFNRSQLSEMYGHDKTSMVLSIRQQAATLNKYFFLLLRHSQDAFIEDGFELFKLFGSFKEKHFKLNNPAHVLIRERVEVYCLTLKRMVLEKTQDVWFEAVSQFALVPKSRNPADGAYLAIPEGMLPLSYADMMTAKESLCQWCSPIGNLPITKKITVLEAIIRNPIDFSYSEVDQIHSLITHDKLKLALAIGKLGPINADIACFEHTLARILIAKRANIDGNPSQAYYLRDKAWETPTQSPSDLIRLVDEIINVNRLVNADLRVSGHEDLIAKHLTVITSVPFHKTLRFAYLEFLKSMSDLIEPEKDPSMALRLLHEYFYVWQGVFYQLRNAFESKATIIASSASYLKRTAKYHAELGNHAPADLQYSLARIRNIAFKLIELIIHSDMNSPKQCVNVLLDISQSFLYFETHHRICSNNNKEAIGIRSVYMETHNRLLTTIETYAQSHLPEDEAINLRLMNQSKQALGQKASLQLQQCESSFDSLIHDATLPIETMNMLAGLQAFLGLKDPSVPSTATSDAAPHEHTSSDGVHAQMQALNHLLMEKDQAIEKLQQVLASSQAESTKFEQLLAERDSLQSKEAQLKLKMRQQEKELKRQSATIRSREIKIEQLEAKLAAKAPLESSLVAARSQALKLTAQLQQAQAERDEQAACARGQQRSVALKAKQLTETREALKQAQLQVASYQKQMYAAQRSLADLKAEQDTLTAAVTEQLQSQAQVQIETKDKEIDELSQRLAVMTLQAAHVPSAKAQLLESERTVALLRAELGETQATIQAIIDECLSDNASYDFKALSQTPASSVSEILCKLDRQTTQFKCHDIELPPLHKAQLKDIGRLINELNQPSAICPQSDSAASDVAYTQTQVYAARTFIDGGYPRDIIAHLKFNDIDLITTRPVEWMLARNGEIAGFNFVQVARVPHLFRDYENQIDLVCDPNLDLSHAKSRDLTCNALYLVLEQDKWHVLDPLNQGVTDIKTKTLRMVGGNIQAKFKEDASRALRLLRLHFHTGWQLSQEQYSMILAYSDYLRKIPFAVFVKNIREIMQLPLATDCLFQHGYISKIFGSELLSLLPILDSSKVDFIRDVVNNPTRYSLASSSPHHYAALILSMDWQQQQTFTDLDQYVSFYIDKWDERTWADVTEKRKHGFVLCRYIQHYQSCYQSFLLQQRAPQTSSIASAATAAPFVPRYNGIVARVADNTEYHTPKPEPSAEWPGLPTQTRQ